jgi:hypothetical protein
MATVSTGPRRYAESKIARYRGPCADTVLAFAAPTPMTFHTVVIDSGRTFH